MAIAEFNNLLIIRSSSLLSCLNHPLTAIFQPRAWLQLRMSRILFVAKNFSDGITHEQTIIFHKFFVGSEREEKLYRMRLIFPHLPLRRITPRCINGYRQP